MTDDVTKYEPSLQLRLKQAEHERDSLRAEVEQIKPELERVITLGDQLETAAMERQSLREERDSLRKDLAEINEYERQRALLMDDLRQERDELKVACAAIREALEKADKAVIDCATCRVGCADTSTCCDARAKAAIASGLSSSAGRDLLERMRLLEAVVEAAIHVKDTEEAWKHAEKDAYTLTPSEVSAALSAWQVDKDELSAAIDAFLKGGGAK